MIPYLTEGLGIAVAGSLLFGAVSKFDAMNMEIALNDLRVDMAKLQNKYSLEVRNGNMCRDTLLVQNDVIEKMRADRDNYVPETVETVVYRNLPSDINVTRGDCDDTSSVIDFIRTAH